LKQIKGKAYHEKYRTDADELYLIGVEFNRKDRNIVRFEYEKMDGWPAYAWFLQTRPCRVDYSVDNSPVTSSQLADRLAD
jgi:hypothetical protein